MADKIIADFHPDIAIGVGGYARSPILKAASSKRHPYAVAGTRILMRE